MCFASETLPFFIRQLSRSSEKLSDNRLNLISSSQQYPIGIGVDSNIHAFLDDFQNIQT